jgi:hypothetical protein
MQNKSVEDIGALPRRILTLGVLPFGIAEREADVVRFFRTQT